MSDLSPISSSLPGRSDGVLARLERAREGGEPRVVRRGEDRVDFSRAARSRPGFQRQSESSVRDELVERVREQIAQGTYLTEEKIDRAADAIAKALG
ncbi:MAG: flagellar biosynthesis anti-sigma factor FlgM [Planctomycetota bacterium]